MANNSIPVYLIQGDNSENRRSAVKALAQCKEYEKGRKLLHIWVDEHTTRLMDVDKIKRKGLEIVKVKLGAGRLAWMEKQVAIKNGFINE